MKANRRFSLMDRFISGKSTASSSGGGASSAIDEQLAAAGTTLKGTELEQAYRALILENHVLAETNARLHERLTRIEAGLEESPAAQYENLNLKREKKKLIKENQKLAASLSRHMHDIQPLLNQEQISRRELEEAKVALREKTNALAKLTDQYYQLEARSKSRPPPSSAANG